MSIKIIIKHHKYVDEDQERAHIYREKLKVDNLDTNLMSYIGCDDYDFYTVFFINPYTKSYEMLLEEGRFPFVVKEGKYEWHVSPEEVTVRDFINTYDIDENATIKFEEGGLGGGGVDDYITAFVEWIPYILGYVGYFSTLKDIVKVVMPIYHKLIGKDNRLVTKKEFMRLLQSRTSWTMKELESRTTLDSNLIEAMLTEAGFVNSNDHYILQSIDNENQDNEEIEKDSYIDEQSQKIWGETTPLESKLFELREAVHDLNLSLTGLMFLSKHYKSDAFNVMMQLVDCYVDEWEGYITKGEGLRFIVVSKDIQPEDEEYEEDETLHILEHSTYDLCRYASYLCEQLDKNNS